MPGTFSDWSPSSAWQPPAPHAVPSAEFAIGVALGAYREQPWEDPNSRIVQYIDISFNGRPVRVEITKENALAIVEAMYPGITEIVHKKADSTK